jgi:hypothetical protein
VGFKMSYHNVVLPCHDECSGSLLFEELVDPSIPVLPDSDTSELQSSI